MIKVEIEGRVKVFNYTKEVSLVGKVEEAKKRIIFKTNKMERQKKCSRLLPLEIVGNLIDGQL